MPALVSAEVTVTELKSGPARRAQALTCRHVNEDLAAVGHLIRRPLRSPGRNLLGRDRRELDDAILTEQHHRVILGVTLPGITIIEGPEIDDPDGLHAYYLGRDPPVMLMATDDNVSGVRGTEVHPERAACEHHDDRGARQPRGP